MKTMRKDRERGSLLLIVAAFMLIFSSIIGAWLYATSTDSRQTNRKVAHTQAFYLAEGGSAHAKQWITSQVQVHAQLQGTYQPDTVLSDESLVDLGSCQWLQDTLGASNKWVRKFDSDDHYYTAAVEVTGGGFYPPLYKITSWGMVNPDGVFHNQKDDELIRKIVVKVFLGSYARYAYFTNYEPNIWFITWDVLLGPVHTNGHFHIAGYPDFWGLATASEDYFTFYNDGSSIDTSNPSNPPSDVPNFRDGYALNSTYVNYPTDMTEMETAAQGDNGLIIGCDTDIDMSVGVGDITTITYTDEEEQEVWVEGHYEWVPCGICWRCTNGLADYCRYKTLEWVDGYWDTQTVTVTKTSEVYDKETNPEGVAIIYVEGDAELEGTLAGQLSILTEGDITITNDVLYNVNPVDYDGDGLLSDANGNGVNDPAADRTGDGDTNDPGEAADDTDDDNSGVPDEFGYDQPESTDVLGIVAKGDVIVEGDYNPSEVVNRTISGSIMALGLVDGRDGEFRVEDYNYDLEGTLTVVGGIVQKERGPVGQFTGGLTDPVITKGFMKNYIYDRRLLYYPPPYFPPTNLLDLIYWQEVPYWSSN
jgi:hypothetical protein